MIEKPRLVLLDATNLYNGLITAKDLLSPAISPEAKSIRGYLTTLIDTLDNCPSIDISNIQEYADLLEMEL